MTIKATLKELLTLAVALKITSMGDTELLFAYKNAPVEIQEMLDRQFEYVKETFGTAVKDAAGAGDGGSQR